MVERETIARRLALLQDTVTLINTSRQTDPTGDPGVITGLNQ